MSNVEEVVSKLYPILKSMKTFMNDVVVIHNRHIIFICDATKLSVLELQEDTFISICCLFSDIENMMNPKAPNYSNGLLFYNYNGPLYYSTLEAYNKYVTSCNECLASVERFDEEYPELVNINSKSDYVLFNVAGMVFTYMPGIMKVNKSDTVSLDIYKGIYEDTYILRYDLYKKKLKNTISIYMTHFKIN